MTLSGDFSQIYTVYMFRESIFGFQLYERVNVRLIVSLLNCYTTN